VLHNFGEGAGLNTTFVEDIEGNLYGTTVADGGNGSVFKLTPRGRATTLYYFSGGSDGSSPNPELAIDKHGNLYGTTHEGGSMGAGVVFKFTQSGDETVLYNFCLQTQCLDGSGPHAGPIRDASGTLYGTTAIGGQHNGGTVFKLDSGGTFTKLYDFRGGNDGRDPFTALTMDTAGNLYGTTPEGGQGGHGGCHDGPPGCGVVFKVTPAGKETVLHAFGGNKDGIGPFGTPIVDPDGNVYGTTFIGGNEGCPPPLGRGCGTMYKVTPAGKETVLYRWKANSPYEYDPFAGLVRDKRGNLYGATEYGGDFSCDGGSGCGTIFKLSPGGKLTVLYTFENRTDGAHPRSKLLLDSHGNLYGTTVSGTAFKISPLS
jgi:uncharacterized repeat protein (TIGR03803 family)